LKVFTHGELIYEDIFRCRHWMKFCYYWHPESKGFAACETHNDTGDYECKK
jgi:hypothetical protein